MRRLGVTVVAACAAATAAMLHAPAIRAQDGLPAQEPPAPMFKSAADLVVLHVNVFDGRSDSVPDLPESAFTVFEDGQPQPITMFAGVDVPVAVGLVIDNSSSMIARRAMVLAGVRAFAESSHAADELFTIVFNEHVRMGLPGGVPFVKNRTLVLTSVDRYPPGGKTAVYDAVIAGLDHLPQSTLQKRVLIVLSDGEDNASRATREQMLGRAAESGALIYTVARRGGDGAGDGDPGTMKALSRATGGVSYFARSEREVVESFTEIAENIRRGYSIGYAPPTSGDGRYHRVRVAVEVAGRKLTARTRDGYVAPDHTSSR